MKTTFYFFTVLLILGACVINPSFSQVKEKSKESNKMEKNGNDQ